MADTKKEIVHATTAGAVGAGVGASAFAIIGGVGVAALGTAVGLTLVPFIAVGTAVGLGGYGLVRIGKEIGAASKPKD